MDDILRKNKPITDEQRRKMKQDIAESFSKPAYGEEMIREGAQAVKDKASSALNKLKNMMSNSDSSAPKLDNETEQRLNKKSMETIKVPRYGFAGDRPTHIPYGDEPKRYENMKIERDMTATTTPYVDEQTGLRFVKPPQEFQPERKANLVTDEDIERIQAQDRAKSFAETSEDERQRRMKELIPKFQTGAELTPEEEELIKEVQAYMKSQKFKQLKGKLRK